MSLLFIDSNNRDSNIYPNGNYYVIHLTRAIKDVERVEVVSAVVPNTIYNLTNGTAAITYDDTNVTLDPGFYATNTLAKTLSGLIPDLKIEYIISEGLFIFYNDLSPFTIQVNSSELATLLGMVQGQTLSSVPGLNTSWHSSNVIKSSTLVDFSLNSYFFLDIAELKTPAHIDTGAMDSTTGTISGQNVNRAFAPIMMDVNSGTIKNFLEKKDYKISVEYPEPINSIDRLTISWVDRHGTLLNFQGYNSNSFILRFYTKKKKVYEEIVEKAIANSPIPETLTENQIFDLWVIIMGIILGIVGWKSWLK